MRKLLLLASVGALAVSVPVLAFEQDRGRGGGQGKGQNVEANQKGGGKGRAERGRGRGGEARAERRERGGESRAERRGRGDEDRAERRGRGREDRRADRRIDRQDRSVERALRGQRREVREARRGERRFDDDRREIREARRVDRRDWNRLFERRQALRDRFDGDFRGRRLAVGPNGCPPGLARQNRFCMPPGQLRKAGLIGQRLPLAQLGYNIPERYRYRFTDRDDWIYRYDDMGHVFRLGRRTGVVDAVFPLFANSLMIGEPLPLGYEVYNVPLGYRGFYPDTRNSFYRYDDGAIYRVDPQTRMVQGIVALLTGGPSGLGGLGVGDTLPAGYDVYNVPFDHRDRYYDTNDSMYRYADGAIYQVDPQTRLIQSIISLLV